MQLEPFEQRAPLRIRPVDHWTVEREDVERDDVNGARRLRAATPGSTP
jgi:hypothetical protein